MGGSVNPLVNYLIKDNRQTAKNLSTIFGEINITKDLVFRSEFHTEFKNLGAQLFSANVLSYDIILYFQTSGAE